MVIVAFLDNEGNVRPPETWEEVQESICNRWDSCSPCPYAHGYNMNGGGFNCTHPLHPNNLLNRRRMNNG